MINKQWHNDNFAYYINFTGLIVTLLYIILDDVHKHVYHRLAVLI